MRSKNIWLLLAAAVFLIVLFLPTPAGLQPQAKTAAAIALVMGICWVSETLPIAVTSLLPLVFFPLFSVMGTEECARSYGDPVVFLFMGGFMLALAMEKSGLEKRIALHLIHTLGGSPRRILAGFMIATGFISMWVSNTATTMMMFPIAMAVIEQFRKEAKSDQETCNSFSIVVMMAIAYASSIGGIATLVGTPPNMIFAGQVKKLFPEFGEIVFTRWFLLCFPIAAGFLAISWAYLAFVTGRKMKRVALKTQIISGEIAKLGPWKKDEVRVMIIFLFAVFAWILRSDIPFSKTFTLPGWEGLLGLKGVHDGTVAMAAAVLLFILPSGKGDGDRLLDWPHAVKMPWDVLLLFGGGFALAASFQSTGLAAWLARDFHFFNGMPLWMVIGGFSLVTVFVSEFMSNSPQVTIMTPILAAAAKSLGVHPYWLMIPCTLMTSLAFMMPAGTPPNAIVFGSGHLSMRQMMRTGFVLNLLAVVWVTVMICWLLPLFFNVFLPAGTP